MSSESNIRLAIFGCWNNYTGTLRPRSDFDYVSKYLTDNQHTYNELIILGDNYYPDKVPVIKSNGEKLVIDGKQIKTAKYNKDELLLGFKALESIHKPKFLIMGNHDLEDTLLNRDSCIGLKDELSAGISKRIKKIYPKFEDRKTPIITEYHIGSETKETDELLPVATDLTKQFLIPFPYGSRDIQIGSLKYKYIFIDTNAYNLANPDITDIESTCFKVIGKTAYQVKVEQEAFIRECFEDSTTNIFLVFGHQPLSSAKTSDGKIKKDTLFPKNELAELLLTSRKTIYYICADVHMFQHGIIRGYGHSLEQIVCGTGGADMDNFTLHMQIINKETIDYDLQRVAPSYGFVDMIISDSGIRWTYYKIKEDATREAYSMKYLIKY